MNLTLRKARKWPYAASSTGRPRGTLPLGSRGVNVLVFEAIGEARATYITKVSKAIIDHLNENADKLRTSGSLVDLSLFMIGKSAEKTKPMVMFVSEDEEARTEAFHMIKQCDIMKEFPGFEIGHMDLKAEFENLEVLGGVSSDCADCTSSASSLDTLLGDELPEVFTNRKGPIIGRRLQVRVRTGTEVKLSHAVAGGVIHHKGTYYLHTVSHFLSPTETTATSTPASALPSAEKSLNPSETSINWDATGLSDFDDDSDEIEDEDHLVQATSRGSATPKSNAADSLDSYDGLSPSNLDVADQDNLPATTLRSKLEVLAAEHNTDQKSSTPPHANEKMVRVGRVAMLNKRLDSALIKLDTESLGVTETDLQNIALPFDDFLDNIEPPRTTDSPIRVATPDGGFIDGTLSGTPSFLRLPHSSTFETAYVAKLNRSLAPGDCGSWVRDVATGKVLGYVVAGSLTTGLVMLLPAKNVAEIYSGRRPARCAAHRRAIPSATAAPTENTFSHSRRRCKCKGRVEPCEQRSARSLHDHWQKWRWVIWPLIPIFVFAIALPLQPFFLAIHITFEAPISQGIIPEPDIKYLSIPWETYLPILFSVLLVAACFSTRGGLESTPTYPFSRYPGKQHESVVEDHRTTCLVVIGLAQIVLSHGSAGGMLSRVWEAFLGILRSSIKLEVLAITCFAWLVAGVTIYCALNVTRFYDRRSSYRLRHIVASPKSGGAKNDLEYMREDTFGQKPRWKMLPTLLFGIIFLIYGNLPGNAVQFGVYFAAAVSSGVDAADHSKSTVTFYAVAALTVTTLLRYLAGKCGVRLQSKLESIMGMLKLAVLLGLLTVAPLLIVSRNTSLGNDTHTHRSEAWSTPTNRWLAFVMALSFLANINTQTHSMTWVKQEIAKEGLLPYRLAFQRRASTLSKLGPRPLVRPYSEPGAISPVVWNWALHVLLVLIVGSTLEHKPAYSFRAQFLSFLVETVVRVLATVGIQALAAWFCSPAGVLSVEAKKRGIFGSKGGDLTRRELGAVRKTYTGLVEDLDAKKALSGN